MMNGLNQRLWKTLGLSSLAFLITGLGIQIFLTPAPIVLVVDQSYCPAPTWQKLLQDYHQLYQSNQHSKIRIESVILLGALGEQTFSSPPPPKNLQSITPYGYPNLERQRQLQDRYPKAKFLRCSSR